MVNTIPAELENVDSSIVENGLFQVFRNARVFRINKNGKTECSQYNIGKKNDGYYGVNTMVEGKQKHFYVHRLLATAFIPNPENKPQVNHVDGNKLNNEIENLEWVTPKENVKHAYKSGLNNPYKKNGSPCNLCGTTTRAEDDICPGCKVDIKSEFYKEVTITKIKESVAHIDTSSLTPRQREAVEMRSQGVTLREVGERLGMTRQGADALIKQAEKRAIRKSKPSKADIKGITIMENRKIRKEAQRQILISQLKEIDDEIESINQMLRVAT